MEKVIYLGKPLWNFDFLAKVSRSIGKECRWDLIRKLCTMGKVGFSTWCSIVAI